MTEIPNTPNKEKQDELRKLMKEIADVFEKLKVGQVTSKHALTDWLHSDMRTVTTAINVLRINGMLIIEDRRGMFLCKNREQYDIWWKLYMQPAMQTLIAIQKGMSYYAKKLPQILKPRKGNGEKA